MEKYKETDFIIIDDDFINNIICQKIIQSELSQAKIVIFTNPQKGLAYIDANYDNPVSNNVILFLDIKMPALNGWDILEQLADSREEVKKHLRIFLLSSSVTPEDKQKAAHDPIVAGYIEKPLTQDKLQVVLPGYLIPV